ncbi:MAG TPA: aspartate-semialdehyde dehydrogenase [Candidatus Acidoferrales bacterium]|nr:aspartate-semialdehyde dehydrogenase [Candidatus Acidoferrales bacterium]
MTWNVGILGATGAVGQKMIRGLVDHPWFRITEVAASERSAGKTYAEAARWLQESPIPGQVEVLEVKFAEPGLRCDFVLSALDSSVAGPIEEQFARAGYPVISNSRNHRMEDDVPLVIPEINPDHLNLIAWQKEHRGFTTGYIVTNPNCSTVGLAMALKPLDDAFGVSEVFVATMQAVSGAGYPGVASLDAIENVIPFISGEEEKMQTEPRKILGKLAGHSVKFAEFKVSPHCNRVPVLEGHLESVSVRFKSKATAADVRRALVSWIGEPQRLGLPTAPKHPILVSDEADRPQPRKDRDAGRGMTVSVGRIRPCEILDFRFTLLVHNTIRGAAGAAILNAELLADRGMLPHRDRLEESVVSKKQA